MTTYRPYRYSLSLTSQFYFCGLPLRLDSYDTCLFSCTYCFAADRGGNRGHRGLQTADASSLRRALERARTSPTGVVGELMAHRQPIHFGGMSDPFPDLERTLGITHGILDALASESYPTLISTKGTMVAEDRYVECLKRGEFAVQFSFSTRDDKLAEQIEHGAPSPSARLRALTHLANERIPVAVRLQPFIPGRESEADEFLHEIAELGASHVGVEHLKLPVERATRLSRLQSSLQADLRSHYEAAGANREGREWILPALRRLPTILRLQQTAHSIGLSFGAADSDLLPLSDGDWCCSGADSLLPGGKGFEFNYLGAVRRAQNGSDLTFDLLRDCWVPSGSIAMMINSHSRLPGVNGGGAGVADYIRTNWNGRSNGCSPEMFYGVSSTGRCDDLGLRTYRLSDELLSMISARLPSGKKPGLPRSAGGEV